MKSAIIIFPGSNCDRDAFTVAQAAGNNSVKIWHAETALPKVDLVILPGGFSYGDYLRSGAMAARAPIMRAVAEHAGRGGLVLGVCNGFQILTEAGLLPGTLLRNKRLKFLCRDVFLRVENTRTPLTRNYRQGQVVNFPIAHHDGNYFADAATLQTLEDNDQVVFRYCDAQGAVADTPAINPNGSAHNVAGVCNASGNVLGLMPHPERHAESLLGGKDGLAMFRAA